MKLTLPPISEQPDPKVEIRPVYVEEWVESLPYADPGRVVQKLSDALSRFNRSPVKPATRLALLELYLRAYEFLLELQEKQGAIHSMATLEKYRTDTEAARKLAVEMAYGYKIVLADSLGKKSLWGKNKQLVHAVQRSALFLGYSLLASYHEYLPTPQGLWIELADLYRFAVSNKLDEESVGGIEGDRPEFRSSVSDLYKRVVLTSLADPFHLPYGEAWEIFRSMRDHASAVQISAMREVEKPAGFFVIDPNADQPPRAYVQLPREDLDKAHLLFDASLLVAALRKRIEEIRRERGERDEEYDRQEIMRLSRLTRTLGLPPQRHNPREASGGKVTLPAGLSTVHYFLGGKPSAGAEWKATETDGTDEEIEIGGADEGPSPAIQGHTYSAEYWELVNRGPSGIGVIKHIRPNNAVGVGELIGIQFGSNGHVGEQWAVGVVRWLSIASAGEFQAGVQILAGNATAATICRDGEQTAGTDRLEALVLPPSGTRQEASLLVRAGRLAPGAEVVLESGGESTPVRIDARAEATPSFERFTYQRKQA